MKLGDGRANAVFGRRAGRWTSLVGATAVVLICALVIPLEAAPSWASVRGSSLASEGHPVNPSYFETGSCESFEPTAHARHVTVFLDAGHGGVDPGAVGTTASGQTIYEANETLPVELDAMALLRSAGFTVVVSRTGPSLVARPQPGDITGGILTAVGGHREVVARDICANEAKAQSLIGIYFDAGTAPTEAGCLTAYDTARPFSAQNQRLATLVNTDVLNAMNAKGWTIPDKGVITDTTVGSPALLTAGNTYDHLALLGPPDPGYITTPSDMPGALIEPLFITNPTEAGIAQSTVGQQAIAQGLATATEQYFGPPPTTHAKHTAHTHTDDLRAGDG